MPNGPCACKYIETQQQFTPSMSTDERPCRPLIISSSLEQRMQKHEQPTCDLHKVAGGIKAWHLPTAALMGYVILVMQSKIRHLPAAALAEVHGAGT